MPRLIPHHSVPPSLSDMDVIARAAFAEIPDELRRVVTTISIVVEDFPDEEVEQDLGLESPFDLLGLYVGIPLPEQHGLGSQPREDVDRIFLYRRPILDYWCDSGDDLSTVVKHVLIHEIGHHFGFSDEDMDRIEAETW